MGGYTIITQNLYNEFINLGHNVKIITPNRKVHEEYPDTYFLGNCQLEHKNSLELFDTFNFEKEAVRLIKKIRPDIVHTMGAPKYGCIGYLTQNDRTFWIHTFITQSPERSLIFKRFIYKILFRKVNLITVTAESQKMDIEEKLGLKVNKVIGVGVDTNSFAQCENGKGDEIVIGAVSNFVWLQKVNGIILLIDSMRHIFKEYPDVKLLIVGYGEYKNKIEDAIIRNNLEKNILLLGKLNRELLMKFYNKIDIFAHISFQDTKPLTILEAMSSGLPIVASAIGDIPEMVDDSLGFVTNFDEKNISDSLIKLIKSRELRMKFGQNSRKKAVENYSWTKIADDYLNVYQEVINGK